MRVRDLTVLQAFTGQPDVELTGLDLADAIGWLPGTTWPTLARLERLGHITSRWADHDPPGRRRRYYRATNDGVRAAQAASSTLRQGYLRPRAAR